MAIVTAPASCQLRPTPCSGRSGRFFAAGVRPQRCWTVCQAQQQGSSSGAEQQPEVSRRSAVLGALALAAVAPLLSPPAALAENEAITRGLSKYIRKKKYDRIDSYLPPLVAARGQLVRSGYLIAQDPSAARQMLREGAFSGLRDNVRAVGEYAAQQGQADAGTAAVTGFFKALEGYDYFLLQASRSTEDPSVEEGQAKLKEAAEALDKLLALAPPEMVGKAEAIVSELEAEVQSQLETLEAERQLRLQQEAERLEKLL